MMGKHKCVHAFLKKDHEDIHIIVAVICCISSERGSKCLMFNIDETLGNNELYVLEKSFKQLLLLEQFQTKIQYKKILKYVNML